MFMYTCACNTLKKVPSLLVRDSLGGRAIFHDSFSFFLYFMIFWIFYTGRGGGGKMSQICLKCPQMMQKE